MGPNKWRADNMTYLFDGSNGKHVLELKSQTVHPEAHLRALFDDVVAIVSPLWGSGIAIKFHAGSDKLEEAREQLFSGC